MHHFFHNLHFNYSEVFKIEHIYPISAKGFIKHSERQLIYYVMNCMMKNLNLSRIPSRIFPKEDYNKEINIPKIDNNEKKVLQRFCSNSRVCLNKLAKELSLSPRAIAKIQKRLEKKEIIKKYSIKVNSSKLGINIFSFIIAKEKTPLVNGLDDWANKEPNIVCCYKSIDCSTN